MIDRCMAVRRLGRSVLMMGCVVWRCSYCCSGLCGVVVSVIVSTIVLTTSSRRVRCILVSILHGNYLRRLAEVPFPSCGLAAGLAGVTS